MLYRSRTNVSPAQMRLSIEEIIASLREGARYKGTQFAVDVAMQNVNGNIHYLLETLGHLQVLEMVGELQEMLLQAAMEANRNATPH